ncbi:MAG TPA: hypothetical protein VE422_28750 [Terriglobia bacterium]|nr:hypothetical protein [Terriglobia bacterium]
MKIFRRIFPVLFAGIWLGAGFTAQAATIVVDSNSDGFVLIFPGHPVPPPVCTLRDAITAANTNVAVNGCSKGDPGLDTIIFDIGSGTPTIRPNSMLPVILEPIFIKGDSGGATRVEIDGTAASRWLLFGRVHGLYLVGGRSTIRNMVINRFSGDGIVLDAITGGVLPDPTPPSIPDKTLPVIPRFARPQEPDCPPGGGSAPPDIPDVQGAGASNLIVGCFIGTDSTGTIALGNGSGIETAGIVTITDFNIIGGSTPAERNVISGNRGQGLLLAGRGNYVRGNFIGTDVTGTLALGNQFDGINIAGGQLSSATGAIGASLNSADPQCGVVIDAATGRVVNDHPECGNRIAFNSQNGITGGFNRYWFLSNSIFSNGSLGIDADLIGVTPNAVNSSRNFPVWTSAVRQFMLLPPFVGTRVTGSITNRGNQEVVVQIFHSPTCDPSGNGEGQDYVGSVRLPANGTFSFFLPRIGGFVTATSTTRWQPLLWTSEFSACIRI